jgi:nucleoside-diphosphate-sugar epimerase
LETPGIAPDKRPLRVAVTGGSGRIGSYVIRALLARNHAPVNFDRNAPQENNCPFVKLEMTDREAVRAELRGFDALCHLAEIPNISKPMTEDGVFQHNTRASSNVMMACADLGISRLIYTSTCQVYGCWGFHSIAPETLPFDETHTLRPQNAYSVSKVANEHFARLMQMRHGLSVAIFRFPWVVATELDAPTSPGWKLLRAAAGVSDGFGTYLHAADAAEAYALALEKLRPGCDAYHFVANDVFSAIPISERLRRAYPDYPSLPTGWPDYKCPVSTQKALAHFGWSPVYSVRAEFERFFGPTS